MMSRAMTGKDTCATCAAYEHLTGECRKRPPAPIVRWDGFVGAWPAVTRNEWCLEHVPKLAAEDVGHLA